MKISIDVMISALVVVTDDVNRDGDIDITEDIQTQKSTHSEYRTIGLPRETDFGARERYGLSNYLAKISLRGRPEIAGGLVPIY